MQIYTPGNETSGSAVTGSRTNETTPMASSTTNSTIGGSGWRMAHAEMFFMSASRASGCRLPPRGRLRNHHVFPVAQEAGRGGHHALGPGEAGGDDHALIRGVRDTYRAPLGLVVAIHDV